MRNVWELPPASTRGRPGWTRTRARSVAAARSRLDRELGATRASATRPRARCCSPATPTSTSRGAGRWPRPAARRGARSRPRSGCSSSHPELTFNQSTAQLYAFLEEDDPELLARVEALVADGPLRADRRHVGRARLRDAVRRVARPPAPLRPALLPRALRRRAHRLLAARLLRLHACAPAAPARRRHRRASSRSSCRGRRPTASRTTCSGGRGWTAARVLAHMFDNPDGGYNGVVGPRSALRHLAQLPAAASATPRACCRSATATAAAGRPSEMVERVARAGRLPRPARPALRPRRRVLRPRGAQRGRARSAGLGRASSTWSCTAGR